MHAHNYKINSSSCNLVFSPLHNAYGSTLVSFCIVWALPISLWICSFVQLYCVSFFCLHTWWKGSSHSLCLAVCHVCMYHWTLFSLPENAWFGWQGFWFVQLFCVCFFCLCTWWKGSCHSLRVPVCQLCTIELFFFPSQECFIGNNLTCPTLLCLFVCLSPHIVEGMKSQPLCCLLPSMYHFPHQMLFSVCNMCEFIVVNFNSGSD